MSLDPAWLPDLPGWSDLLDRARGLPPAEAMPLFRQLAGSRMDFLRTGRLDKAFLKYVAGHPEATAGLERVRVALLGSSTLSHLVPGIRMGGLRRSMQLELYTGPYGLYRQELADPTSALHKFQPDVVCLALDAEHLAGGEHPDAEAALATMEQCWQLAKALGARAVLQQTLLPRFPALLGNNEELLPSSPAAVVAAVNTKLRSLAAAAGVSLLSMDTWAAQDGVAQWFSRSLWHQAKQEVHPQASVVYGDQLARLIAALWGRSAKCLVLDLDNTLWGGVIGDDGMDGIALGQGSPAGEAFAGFQRYAKRLRERGVLLAVCSKNDEANALEPFLHHPEMVLRREDITSFRANWTDKATNLRAIAAELNIGLDALVFADDNPAERRLIRAELPMVHVPEMPDDPADYAQTIADAGYFEAASLTTEDRERTELYRANAQRAQAQASATDLGAFLDGLQMQLHASAFDMQGLRRIAQLMNKTNQFNLTTKRYTETDVEAMIANPGAATLQLRLTDVHGDNGIIALTVAYRQGDALAIDTWLMSCRVLGRGVEEATLNLLAAQAQAMGCTRLTGEYRPTAKNSMVRDLYARLGFVQTGETEGTTRWELAVAGFTPRPTHMQILEKDAWTQTASIAS